MKHAIVTGAAGFIGKALVKALCQDGVDVVAIDRESIELPCDFIVADIERPFLLNEFLSPNTVVFHLAAHASVVGSVKDPRFDFNINVAAFIEILESVRNARASLVFPSSAAVFDPHQQLPHKEAARKRPVSPYGASKLSCEAYCAAYHSCYQLDVKVARLFNVYGAGMTRFAIHDFYQKIARNPTLIEILGDGEQLRDYLYIDDVVRGLIHIADVGEPGQDYNLASGVATNLLDLARAVATIMGYPSIDIVTRGGSFPGDVSRWYADIQKIRDLGFVPTVGLEAGLRRTLAWFDEQAHLQTGSTAVQSETVTY